MSTMKKVEQVSLVPLETKDPLVKEWVLKDKDGEVIRGDFGTEISFNDAVVTIKRLSPFFSRRFEHHYMLADAYEAPLILGEEEERDHWIPTTFVRVQKLLYKPVKRCGPDTVAEFLEDKSKIEMTLENDDGTFLFRKVDVRIRITPRDEKEIESIECGFDMEGERKWRSWLEVKYKEDPSKVRYDITSYQDHIRGRLLLGRGQFSTNDQKEVYRGVLDKNGSKEKVALKILNCRLNDDWQGAIQGVALDGLVIDDVGDSIVHEIAIMQEIKSLLPNGEHPHLAVDVKGIYITVSDTQRTGHLLVAFPYQSNSSLSLFLDSKKFTSSGSEQQMKMIRFFANDIAMALQQLHEVGYAHLDLTAEDVVVTADNRCMLIGFGQATKTNVEVAMLDIDL
eukprot:gene6832-7547_t